MVKCLEIETAVQRRLKVQSRKIDTAEPHWVKRITNNIEKYRKKVSYLQNFLNSKNKLSY